MTSLLEIASSKRKASRSADSTSRRPPGMAERLSSGGGMSPAPEPPLPKPQRAYSGEKPPQLVPPQFSDPATNFIHPDFLVHRDFNLHDEGPQQAYMKEPFKEPIEIKSKVEDHNERKWGEVIFCMVYERVGPIAFQALKVPKYVAVKRLNKRIYNHYLNEMGGQENPYIEVSRMMEFENDEHVLTCIEFLEDDKYLYIVTPKAAGGTLAEAIHWFSVDPDERMESARIAQIFANILEILGFLARKGICHRDLKPHNFLFLTDNRLVVFDLAMSIRIPVDDNGHHCLIKPQRPCGTQQFMAPEIYQSTEAFDGVAVDLYSAAVILYSLLTNHWLYNKPRQDDPFFRLFVTARNLSPTPQNNDDETAAMQQINGEGKPGMLAKLKAQWEAHQYISDGALLLLENLLKERPQDRYSLLEATQAAKKLGDNFRPPDAKDVAAAADE